MARRRKSITDIWSQYRRIVRENNLSDNSPLRLRLAKIASDYALNIDRMNREKGNFFGYENKKYSRSTYMGLSNG